MDCLFSVIYEVFPPGASNTNSSWVYLSFQALLNLIVFLQNLQFLWYSNMQIPYWADYETFWNVVSSPGLYKIIVSLGLIRELTFISMSIVIGILSIYMLFFGFKLLKKQISPTLCLVTRIGIEIVCNFCFIPIILIFLRIIFNSENISYREEYSEDADFGNFGKILAWIGVFVVSLLMIIYEGCNYDARPQVDESLSNSKIDSNPDLCIKFVQIVNCFLINFLSKSNQERLLIADVFMYGICSIITILKLPYYSNYFNFFKSFWQLNLSFLSLFFFIGFREQNAAVIIVLSITMQPVIAFITYSLIISRSKAIKSLRISSKNNFSTLELSLRPKLRTDTDEMVLKKLNNNYILSKDRRNRIITAYYCNDVLLNCSLALNKISTTSHQGLNIPLNYQIYKCKQILIKVNKEYSLSYKLNMYIKVLIKLREKDKDFCIHYYKFFSTILKKDPTLTELKDSALDIMMKCDYLKKFYIKSAAKFNSREFNEMYGTFLINIIGDTGKGQDILGHGWKISASQMNSFNSLIKDKLILKVSAELGSFGKICFMNKEFSLFFKHSIFDIDDFFISSLFPSVFLKYHEKRMLHFVDKSVNTVLYEGTLMYLLDSQSFIHECVVRAECVTFDGLTSFIFSISPLKKEREYALVTVDGQIYEHSNKLPELFGTNKSKICGCPIQDLVPDSCFEKFLQGSCDDCQVKNNQDEFMKVVFKKLNILNTVIYAVYFIDDTELVENDFFSVAEKECESFLTNDITTSKGIYDTENEGNKIKPVEIKSKMSSYSSAAPILSPKEANSLKKSFFLLNISKVILLILVLSI